MVAGIFFEKVIPCLNHAVKILKSKQLVNCLTV
jgi:hypothetical protein